MSAWMLGPVLIPAISAVILLFLARRSIGVHRFVSVIGTLSGVGVSLGLLLTTLDGTRSVVSMGDWPVPFGIVFVVDRLSATMLVLTGLVALGALGAALRGWDERGRNFHALFQFQLMGVSGAFLTGDIFNLFVFFEILLISAYGLLLHSGGKERIRAGLRFVILNLVGSTFFVIALALVYGSTGTLNMAALSAGSWSGPVWQVAMGLLLVVFGLKAAAVPLHFWLPESYSAAPAPVAVLFAVLTKVGLYAIIRVYGLSVGLDALTPVIFGAGAVGIIVGAVGALASRGMREMVGWLVIGSVSTAMLAIGVGGPEGLSAALYYALHSTLVTGALFLLAEIVTEQRSGDSLESGPRLSRHAMVSGLFLLAAMEFAGLPPTSGFVGKLSVLTATAPGAGPGWIAVILVGGLLALITLSRAGSALFWNVDDAQSSTGPVPVTQLLPVVWLLGLSLALMVFSGPVLDFLGDAASQALDTHTYARDVLSTVGGRE